MQCTLCPRACRAERKESTGNGFCQLPTTMRIARIAPSLTSGATHVLQWQVQKAASQQ